MAIISFQDSSEASAAFKLPDGFDAAAALKGQIAVSAESASVKSAAADFTVDATGVQDLFFEANAILEALLDAIEKNQGTPENWIQDPGFALTQENITEREMDMWGCKILKDAEADI